VDFRKVLAITPNPKLHITSMQLHRGGCFDYLFFGKCTNHQCSFKHDGQTSEEKIDNAIDKMRLGLAKFVEVNRAP
jgi:hypothetical protein